MAFDAGVNKNAKDGEKKTLNVDVDGEKLAGKQNLRSETYTNKPSAWSHQLNSRTYLIPVLAICEASLLLTRSNPAYDPARLISRTQSGRLNVWNVD